MITNTPETSRVAPLKRVPALHRWVARSRDLAGLTVLDYGAGPRDLGTQFLLSEGAAVVYPYDPYYRTQQENLDALAELTGRRVDLVLCSNVLNTLPSVTDRYQVLATCSRAPHALFAVYEGDRSGSSATGPRGCQLTRRVKDYLPEIDRYFTQTRVLAVGHIEAWSRQPLTSSNSSNEDDSVAGN